MLATQPLWSTSCLSYGVCVSEARSEVFASERPGLFRCSENINVLSLLDGHVIRTLAVNDVRVMSGGMAFTHRDTLLLACGHEVVELNPDTGRWIRQFALTSLCMAEYVDCNRERIVVTARTPSYHGWIKVLAWDGTEVGKFTLSGLGWLRGVRLLKHGTVVVANYHNRNTTRLLVVDTSTDAVLGCIPCPCQSWDLCKSADGAIISSGAFEDSLPLALFGGAFARLASGSVVVARHELHGSIAHYRNVSLRHAWVRLCVCTGQ